MSGDKLYIEGGPDYYLCCGNKTGVADPSEWLGIDIEQPADLIADVRAIECLERPERVFATPPCSSFTDLPWRPATNADIDILMASFDLCRQSPKWLLENNRWAQRFLGPAMCHRGPHYFWGNVEVPQFVRTRSKESMSGGSRENSLRRAALPVIWPPTATKTARRQGGTN